MASSFVKTPGYVAGGMGVDAWLRLVWHRDEWVPTGPTINIQYEKKIFPLEDAAIVFRAPAKSHATSKDQGYMANPICITSYTTAMKDAIDGPMWGSDELLAPLEGDIVIPLGTPRWSTSNAKHVLQQSARMWVSGGMNTGDMSDSNVLVMFYGALQSLAYAVSVCADAKDQAWLCAALVALTRNFALLHKEEPTFQKITSAMVMTPGVDDMLQKALAHVFHPAASWDKALRLEMLEIILRRNLRHGAGMLGMASGPFAVFILAPILRTIAQNPEADCSVLERFNAGMARLLTAFVADASSDSATMEVNALVALTTVIGVALTKEQAHTLLSWCKTVKDMSARPDWVTMGVLPAATALIPTVKTERYAVAGKPGASFSAIVQPTSPTHFRVLGFKGVMWSAVQFHTPGVYRVLAHDLGIAKQGEGNTRGQELVANWRLTCGTDILPRELPGYSSAGMRHIQMAKQVYGRIKTVWDYVQDVPVAFSTPFQVVVTPAAVVLRAEGAELWRMARTCMQEPVLLAFKNLWLDVTYSALQEPPKPVLAPAAARGAVNYAAAARGDLKPATEVKPAVGGELKRSDLDLTPAALIAKLREAALKA